VDVFLAGVAGRGVTPRYWERVLPKLDPRVVVPTHYDNFFRPLGRDLAFVRNVKLASVPGEVARCRERPWYARCRGSICPLAATPNGDRTAREVCEAFVLSEKFAHHPCADPRSARSRRTAASAPPRPCPRAAARTYTLASAIVSLMVEPTEAFGFAHLEVC
jgi:hypothetical protein